MSKQLALQMVDAYIEAEKDVLLGKTVTVNGKMMTSEDLDAIRKGRMEWQRTLNAYSRPQGIASLATFN
ncbi:hypothetical protein ABIS04_16250 [Shewanella sp. H8]|uniref:hypothetical protein n=1 Tax=Shewanella sp. H8 TaxID=3342676 RepID=UPI0033153270